MPEADNTEKLQPQGREECAPSLRPVAVVVHSRVSSWIAEGAAQASGAGALVLALAQQGLDFLCSLASPTHLHLWRN